MSIILAAALAYAEQGLPVFPCNPKDKAPLVGADKDENGERIAGTGGFHKATTDAAKIKSWWDQWPDAMIGMPTGPASGIDVLDLDFDIEKGKDGLAELPDWPEHSPIIVRTPRGGAHLWFKSDGTIRNTTDAIAFGVDTRGAGGYVIMPPSQNGAGAYRFEKGSAKSLAELPPFPSDLLVRLRVDDGPRTSGTAPEADPALVAAALAVIPNTDFGWEDWNRVGMAVWRATGGSDAGLAAFDAFSQKSSKYNAAETQQRWDHYFKSPPNQIGAGTLFYMANEASPRSDLAPAFSEEALALQFAARHAGNLRYVAMWNRWLYWDGARWAFDETKKAFSLSRDMCREVAATVNKGAKAIASAKTRAAVISLAGEDRRLAATVGQWDWLLNTPAGTIDLRTGKLQDHRPDDDMTKLAAVAPDASCPTPLWFKFLSTVTGGDKELQEFLARMCGYALTGSIGEHAMFFLHGGGGNGKGVFVNAVSGVMGDYHHAAPIETFTESNTDRHPTELAMLRGARMVTAAETEEGRRWAESKIKALTGGDKIAARFMRQDFFEFTPQFKLIIAGNHKPGLRSVDEAIRRRFNMVPFSVTIPETERDINFSERLKVEWPGILAWMVEGCIEWQKKRLAPPAAVVEATKNYLETEDVFLTFIEEVCVKDPQQSTIVGTIFMKWKDWAEGRGEQVGSSKRLAQRLEAHGFVKVHTRRGSEIQGLGLNFPKKEQPEEGTPKWPGAVM
jgi:putative DNA primase/helicase